MVSIPFVIFVFKPLVITTGGTMNQHFKDFVQYELRGFRVQFKRDCPALLVRYGAMLFPTEGRNARFASSVDLRLH